MQRIELIYRSTNTNPSVVISLFLKMIGIYIFERFLDYGMEEEQSIYDIFPNIRKERETSQMEETWVSDGRICIVETIDDIYSLLDLSRRLRIALENCIVVSSVQDDALNKYLGSIDGIKCIVYSNEQKLLDEIIEVLPFEEEEKSLLHEAVNVYCANSAWQVTLNGRYFYPADTQERYKAVTGRYQTVIDALRQKLNESGINLGDNKGCYVQYAICNLAYEVNFYGLRSNRSEMYFQDSIIKPLLQLMRALSSDNKFRNSVQLLLTQIYEDLLKETNIAYENYLTLCREPYSAFVYFKKANYWKDFGSKPERALQYYEQSVARFPQYYQAWFNMGVCCAGLGYYGDAMAAFQNVKRILGKKRRASVLRPIETEYLYKAYCCCGDIWYNHFGNPHAAIKEDMVAETIWSEIEESGFYAVMAEEADRIYLTNVMKKQFNIDSLRAVIEKLANRVKDYELAKEYNRLRTYEWKQKRDAYRTV